MKAFLTLILFVTVATCHAQPFKKGYFVDNDGARIECMIKRADWTLNPTRFQYKLTTDNDSIMKNVIATEVQEFGIYELCTYKRFTVDYEDASTETRYLTSCNVPKWRRVTLLLKMIVQGDANLYVYNRDDVTKYFFQTADNPVRQLLYLRYIGKRDNSTIAGYEESAYEVNRYKYDLMAQLKCVAITDNDFKNLTYKKEPLVKIFKKYNDCKSGTAILK